MHFIVEPAAVIITLVVFISFYFIVNDFFLKPFITKRYVLQVGMTKSQVIAKLGHIEKIYFVDPNTREVYFRKTNTNEIKKAPIDSKTGKPWVGSESCVPADREVDYEMLVFSSYLADASIYVYCDKDGRVVYYQIAGS